jgi:hypothetical protein
MTHLAVFKQQSLTPIQVVSILYEAVSADITILRNINLQACHMCGEDPPKTLLLFPHRN